MNEEENAIVDLDDKESERICFSEGLGLGKQPRKQSRVEYKIEKKGVARYVPRWKSKMRIGIIKYSDWFTAYIKLRRLLCHICNP